MSNFRFEAIAGSDASFDRQNKRVSRRYRAIDTLPTGFSGDVFDRVAEYALNWVAANANRYSTPWGMLPVQSIQIHENYYALNYEITVEYAPFGEDGQGNAGAYQITVDTSGGTIHVNNGECIGIFGDAPGAIGDVLAIGKDGQTVEGVDIPVSEPKVNVQFRHPAAFLNRPYVRRIGKLVGFPNNDTFLGYAPGEVMYLGGPLTETNTESSASYSFAISYNRTSFTVGGINIAVKKGWDLLVPHFKNGKDAADKPIREVDGYQTIRPAGREWKDYKSEFGWG